MSILQNNLRIGRFTSSEIWKLMTNGKKEGEMGKPALDYIRVKNMERRLDLSISGEIDSRPTSWGSLCEKRVTDVLLSTSYKPLGQDTVAHLTIDCWSGSPDGEKYEGENRLLPEVKCPWTRKSFCELIDVSDADFKKEQPEYWWQMVSNSILIGVDVAELIVYCPYEKEIPDIWELANNWEGDANQFTWLQWVGKEGLPYLKENSYYKNLNIRRFDIPQEDKEQLTQRVIEAGKLLSK